MASWVPVPDDSDFSLRNLPYGVFNTPGSGPRIGVAIGNCVLDLKLLAQEQVFEDLEFDVATLEEATLNAYAGLGSNVHGKVRRKLQQLLEKDTQLGHVLRDDQQRRKRCLIPLDNVTMHLPVTVGDFTDFFIGLHHAKNVSDKISLIIEAVPLTRCEHFSPQIF
jgi:fumarylacetoacetase